VKKKRSVKAMIKEKSLSIGSVILNYAEGPESGPPLLLLHGLPGHWQEFMPVLPVLIPHWHVFALDMRGQGKSGYSPNQYKSRFYVNDIIGFIQILYKEPVTIYGQSAGGLAALAVAAEKPESVSAVILGDSPIDMKALRTWMTSSGFKYLFSAFREIAGHKNLSLIEIAAEIASIPIHDPVNKSTSYYGDRPGMDRVKIRELAAVLYKMDPGVLEYHASGHAGEFLEAFEFDQYLKNIQCPMLLVQGNPELGGMMTDVAVQQVKSIVPTTEHAFLKDYGHDLGLDSWKVASLLRVIVSFLNTLPFPGMRQLSQN
jgi:pimeloyl-ACP methyl ester carboxylesterase